MVNHEAIQLACRARAATLSVATTGTMSLAATGQTYTRATGSFVTDGFRIGMEVLPAGFSDVTRRVVTDVAALTLTVNGTPTAQVAAGSRSLTVGLPMGAVISGTATPTVGWENLIVEPVSGAPYVMEQYLPGGTARKTMGSFGELEVLSIYVLQFYARMGPDMPALAKYADACISHFAPDTPLSLSTGDTTRVRGDPAPTRSQLTNPESGWALVSVSIPLSTRVTNSR